MKLLFTCIFIFISQFSLFSQFKIAGQSDPFDEPQNNYGKLLLLTNGSTAFLLTTKTTVNIKIFDSNHRLKVDKEIEKEGDDIYSIELACEIHGDIILFYTTFEHGQENLFRLLIDGKTGNRKGVLKISSIENPPPRRLTLNFVGPNPLRPGFYVRKDPAGSNYAVAICDTYGRDNGRKIEIAYYNGEQKEIARSVYNAPEKYKVIQYLDMVVIGSQKVAILAFASNDKQRNNRDGELMMATLDSGSHNLEFTELDLSRNIYVKGGIARYNPLTQSVVLLAACREPKENGYITVMAFVDPFNRKVKNIFTVFPDQASSKSQETFGKKNDFTGMPQDMFLDEYGDISVVFEEITTFTDQYGVSVSVMGNLAMSRFDPNGKKTGEYLIPRMEGLDGYFDTFYHSALDGSAPRLYGGNQYKHYSFLNGIKGKDYLLLNELEENDELIKKGKKPRKIGAVSACDAFYFSLNDNPVLPDRQFVFGRPENKKEHQLALFSISDYRRDLNSYVTLKLDRDGRSRQVRVVWLTPP